MNKEALRKKINSIDALSKEEKAELTELLNTKRYGLVWEDKPEAVEEELKTQLPVLMEVTERKIIGSQLSAVGNQPATETIKPQILLDFGVVTDKPQKDDIGLGVPFNDVVLNTQNTNHALIEGDNLHALTVLNYTHANKIDVIYIDPPYNTGNKDFKYNDTFKDDYIDRENPFRHSTWLSFMNRRLRLAKNLLSDKGVIFISIDDNEQAQLKLLCDEIFGEMNFVGELVWEKGKKSDSKFFSITHEYVTAYVKNKSLLIENNVRWRKKKEGIEEVLEKYDSLKLIYENQHEAIKKEMMKWYNSLSKDDPKRKHKHYNNSDDRGLYFPDNFAGPDDGRLNRPRYDIIHPITGKSCSKPSTGWRWDEGTTIIALAQNPPRIHFGKDETTIPCRKSYLFEIDSEPHQSVFYKDGRTATLQVEEIIGKGKFNFPKDTEILSNLIALNGKKDSTILDFFAGSGTTLHAVMALNAEDGGSRQCILVTNNEVDAKTAKDLEDQGILKGTEEFEKRGICQEVTYERNRRVIEGYTNAKGDFVKGLGGNNLRYYRMGYVGRRKTLKNLRELTQKATELLCLKENCYEEITVDLLQTRIFENESVMIIVLFDDVVIPAAVEFIKDLETDKNIKVYVFSAGSDPYTEDFTDVQHKVELCALPDAIYKACQHILPKETIDVI